MISCAYGVGNSPREYGSLKPGLRLGVAKCIAVAQSVGHQQAALQVGADTAHADAVAGHGLFDGAVGRLIAYHAPANGADEQGSARGVVADVGRRCIYWPWCIDKLAAVELEQPPIPLRGPHLLMAVLMQPIYIFVAAGMRFQQPSVAVVFIDFLVGRQPPVPIGSHDDVVDPLVVDLSQPADAVVPLVQDISPMKRADDDSLARLGHAVYIITAQQVGMVSVAAEHQHLPPIVATESAALGSVP